MHHVAITCYFLSLAFHIRPLHTSHIHSNATIHHINTSIICLRTGRDRFCYLPVKFTRCFYTHTRALQLPSMLDFKRRARHTPQHEGRKIARESLARRRNSRCLHFLSILPHQAPPHRATVHRTPPRQAQQTALDVRLYLFLLLAIYFFLFTFFDTSSTTEHHTSRGMFAHSL